MTDRSDFDAKADRALGEVLREHLTAPNEAVFAARVMERIRLEPRDSSWDLLAQWMPRGLAAAATLALAVALGWFASRAADDGSRPVAEVVTSSPGDILTTPEPLSDDQILTVVLEGGGRND